MLYRYLALLLVFTFSTAAVTGTTPTPPSSNSREAIMLIRTVNNQGVDDLMNLENTTPITTGGCSKCSAREEKKNFSLHNIREEILSKLGFTHPPNVTGKNLTVKASIYDLINKQHRGSPYDNMYSQHHWHQPGGMQSDDPSTSSSVFSPEDDDEDDAFFRMDRVLVISQPHPRRHHPRGPVLMFKFSTKTMQHTVQGAILWVYLRSSGTSHNVPVNIEVRKLKPSSPNSNSDKAHSSSDKPYTERVTSKMEIRNNGTDGHWVLFDVKLMVAEWFKSPKSNLGIILEVTPPGEHAAIVTSGNNSNDDALVPFLEMQTKDKKKRRSRRNSEGLTCTEESPETRCCRYPLKVDFEAFGWDWIIAPKSYEANYCAGECQHMFMPKYPHTQLVRYSNTTVAGPCCAPLKTSRISMLYFDNDLNIIFGYLPDMVVDRCGCA
ncbi:hypothetical protein M8J76_006081 [Diaphorina citri]|nr:hypothetical protein M8J75_004847 [Diaphorina citri]KAI5749275.1 hypothetical protein M8J76_006081 [Diaphorina citri]KAI5754575.1 hypothetical protein M8J77_009663 [Diaphorina citri]